MALDSLVNLVDQQLELYRHLLAEQEQKIGMYLRGELDQVRDSMEQDKILLRKIRQIHGHLRDELNGNSVNEFLASAKEARQASLRDKLRELQRLTRELQRVNLRNYRYTQNSLAFTRAMLSKIFSDNASYNLNGYLKAGNGAREFGS
jgi:flagellar biosynthesis/type III secretory pathway chaperone